MNNIDKTIDDIRSDEVHEVLSFMPHWFLKFGILFIFIIILVGLTIANFLKYPQVVMGTINIVASNPSIDIIAKSTGSVTFFTKNNTQVQNKALLGYIQSPTDLSTVAELKTMLSAINVDDLASLSVAESRLQSLPAMKLGELQQPFADALKSLKSYLQVKKEPFNANNTSLIGKQIEEYSTLLTKQAEQIKLLKQDLEIFENKYKNNQYLFDNKAISKTELLLSQSELIQKKNTLSNAEIVYQNNKIQVVELQKSIVNIQMSKTINLSDTYTNLQNSLKTLNNRIAVWESNYLIIAPTTGKVFMNKVYASNQNVNVGDEVLSVITTQDTMIVKSYITTLGAGKVKKGNRVIIKMNDYNYNEFGALEGTVTNMSELPKDNNYVVDISLNNGNTTTYNKKIVIKQAMQGSAEILTEDVSLLQRLFDNFKSLTLNK